jgi:uncharacterized repeat protein (TIGR03803 family)
VLRNKAICKLAQVTASILLLSSCGRPASDGGLGFTPGSDVHSIRALAPATKRLSILHRFQGSDGSTPMGALLIDGGGTLYGTTSGGGASGGFGVVFSLTPRVKGYGFSVLHRFAGGTGGAQPESSLVLADGTLYGTTYAGGLHDLGTVFALSPSGSGFKVIYSFAGGTDGQWPMSTLVWYKGALYGTTYKGGVVSSCGHGCGTVFRMTLTGSETILHRFGGRFYGEGPTSALLVGVNGVLYGTTLAGGDLETDCTYQKYTKGCGTVFEMIPKGGQYTTSIIYRFKGPVNDGSFPNGPLAMDGQGALYGTTEFSDLGQGGTVFSLTPSSSGYTESIFSNLAFGFEGNLASGQIVDLDGTIYGTTRQGSHGFGNVYSTPGGEATALHAFGGGSDGAYPFGGLTYAGGAVYGTTEQGGGCKATSGGCGTVFRLKVP